MPKDGSHDSHDFLAEDGCKSLKKSLKNPFFQTVLAIIEDQIEKSVYTNCPGRVSLFSSIRRASVSLTASFRRGRCFVAFWWRRKYGPKHPGSSVEILPPLKRRSTRSRLKAFTATHGLKTGFIIYDIFTFLTCSFTIIYI